MPASLKLYFTVDLGNSILYVKLFLKYLKNKTRLVAIIHHTFLFVGFFYDKNSFTLIETVIDRHCKLELSSCFLSFAENGER